MTVYFKGHTFVSCGCVRLWMPGLVPPKEAARVVLGLCRLLHDH